jgi:hypothetical protein
MHASSVVLSVLKIDCKIDDFLSDIPEIREELKVACQSLLF